MSTFSFFFVWMLFLSDFMVISSWPESRLPFSTGTFYCPLCYYFLWCYIYLRTSSVLMIHFRISSSITLVTSDTKSIIHSLTCEIWPFCLMYSHCLVAHQLMIVSFAITPFFIPYGLQVEELVERMVKWLKVGGFIFFRESCFHQSGDSKRKVNPTHYREPRFYTKVCFAIYFHHFSQLNFHDKNCCCCLYFLWVTIVTAVD